MPPVHAPLELWGGVECTVNRVGAQWFDQVELTGHGRRLGDLDAIAALGVTALRYPVLWERTMPDREGEADWRWADERLHRLRALGVRPVVTLLHHGSGPRYTSLDDPDFPRRLAAYARAVAERYPWVTDYTPINEPLTTARFSGLYGHWYPHGRDDVTFVRCLLHEIAGIGQAMREIRAVQPAARLILTDDLGFTAGTPLLAYQAVFENERRWLGADLLCGRVDEAHPLYRYLTAGGHADRGALQRLSDEPCPPDVIGINHYLTSNRWLDEKMSKYPERFHGGNGRHDYADVEAVRVAAAPVVTRGALLRQAHERYGIPLAVTEAHLGGGTREDQVRWLTDAWEEAQVLRQDGVDVRAVTAWALLGLFDWHCLVTRCEGRYEAGAFDVRSAAPRPTMVARAIGALARTGEYRHPVRQVPGWWRQPARFLFPAALADPPACAVDRGGILIAGARGTLGRAFARVCEARGLPYTCLSRRELDIADPASVRAALDLHGPWAVINAAGYVRVDDAEQDRERCRRENLVGAVLLARACADRHLPYLTFSSDLVFDGRLDHFVEGSRTRPLNYYGLTKQAAERAMRLAGGNGLIVRTSAFFGPWDDANFAAEALRAAAAGRTIAAADDVWVSPTYVPELVHTALDLLLDGEHGVWHLANEAAITWADLTLAVVRAAGLPAELVVGRPAAAMGWAARRPPRSVLRSSRGALLSPLDTAIARYFQEAPPLPAAA